MICLDCATAADWQRAGKNEEAYPHPSECQCDCQHKPVKAGQIVEQSV